MQTWLIICLCCFPGDQKVRAVWLGQAYQGLHPSRQPLRLWEVQGQQAEAPAAATGRCPGQQGSQEVNRRRPSKVTQPTRNVISFSLCYRTGSEIKLYWKRSQPPGLSFSVRVLNSVYRLISPIPWMDLVLGPSKATLDIYHICRFVHVAPQNPLMANPVKVCYITFLLEGP